MSSSNFQQSSLHISFPVSTIFLLYNHLSNKEISSMTLSPLPPISSGSLLSFAAKQIPELPIFVLYAISSPQSFLNSLQSSLDSHHATCYQSHHCPPSHPPRQSSTVHSPIYLIWPLSSIWYSPSWNIFSRLFFLVIDSSSSVSLTGSYFSSKSC